MMDYSYYTLLDWTRMHLSKSRVSCSGARQYIAIHIHVQHILYYVWERLHQGVSMSKLSCINWMERNVSNAKEGLFCYS